MLRRLARSRGSLWLRLVAILLVIMGLGGGGLLAASRIAHAASLSVSDCSTYGTASQAGTLAKALADATASSDPSDTITFACDTSGVGLVFPSAYAVTKGLTVDASGRSVTLNGNDATRFFTVSAAGNLSLTHLTLTHGFGDTSGGAIQVNDGALTIASSTFTDNVDNIPDILFFRGGGAIAVFGGSLNVTASTFAHNTAARFECDCDPPISQGGAIALQASDSAPVTATVDGSTFSDNLVAGGLPGGFGGAIFAGNASSTTPPNRSAMTLTVTGSTFTHNLGDLGGGIHAEDASLSVSGSVFSEGGPESSFGNVTGGGISTINTDLYVTTTIFAHNLGGAIYTAPHIGATNEPVITRSVFTGNETTNQGGGALTLLGKGIVADSTFTGNSAIGNFGEVAHPLGGGAILNYGDLVLINDTISGNSVGGNFRGSNIYNYKDDFVKGTITYRNTIVANGAGDANCFYEPSSVATDGGHNLDSGTSCGFSSANHSLTNADPKLGPLADNGGPTQTMALIPGSPAIDAASNSICAAAPVSGIDQRGVARPQGAACDIGAYERTGSASTSTTITASAGEVACGQTVTFTAHVTSASGTPVGGVTFKDSATSIGSAALSGGKASLGTSALNTGTHHVSAVYAGGHGHLGSASGAVTVIVGSCDGAGGSGSGSGSGSNAPPTVASETPSASATPSSTETPTATPAPLPSAPRPGNQTPANGGPALIALVGGGVLLALLLAGGGFLYLYLRRRNGGAL